MRVFLLSICLLISFSCASQKKEIVSKSTIKLEGKSTNIRDLIEIDGYYTETRDEESINNVMFFEDGSYVWSFLIKEKIEKDSANNMSKRIETWTEDKQIRWGSYWGIYQISKDTIIGNYFVSGTFLRGWSFIEERYKVIDNTILKKIYWKGLLKADESYYQFKSPWLSGRNLYFFPADSLPSSDCWLKEEKWIWRNESDWKAYMEKIKKKKAEFKKSQ